MSSFFNAIKTNDVVTENGAIAHSTTNSACLDLFFSVGASRGQDLTDKILKAFEENDELATRIMLWSRDIRQGIGERQHFRNFLSVLENPNIQENDLLQAIIKKIPELGRFDDMLVVKNKVNQKFVADFIKELAKDENQVGLLCKWLPREKSTKKETAKWLMRYLSMSTKDYRKFLSSNTKVVENNLCTKTYENINYSHVPSRAMKNYTKCFNRNDESRFSDYKENLSKGETKINAGAVYPHEVILIDDIVIRNEMWKSLPNFMEGCTKKILPVCDVSGSMGTFGYSTNSPITISTALGVYIAQRNEGTLKNLVMTFCGHPDMVKINENFIDIQQEVLELINLAKDMNTNMFAVFKLLLKLRLEGHVLEEDFPDTLLIFSDMEFDYVSHGVTTEWNTTNKQKTLFEEVKNMYKEHDVRVPNVVFWNLEARQSNMPVKMGENNTALVSGYSPSLMKSILKGVTTPYEMMLQTVNIDRYNV